MSSTEAWRPPAGARELAGGKLMLDRPADDVARLTIVNPASRNALDHPILDALAQAVGELDARCLILTGAGGMFSAGYDIAGMPQDTFAQEAEKLVAHPFAAAIEALEAYAYPVVAALSGHTIGGGLEVALSAATCGWRPPGSSWECRRPSWGWSTRTPACRSSFTWWAPPARASCSWWGATWTPQTALAWGLVNEVVDAGALQERALELAVEIAANAPLSCGATSGYCASWRGSRTAWTPSWSASWSSCAAPALPPRTSARECRPSPRSARRAGRDAEGPSTWGVGHRLLSLEAAYMKVILSPKVGQRRLDWPSRCWPPAVTASARRRPPSTRSGFRTA